MSPLEQSCRLRAEWFAFIFPNWAAHECISWFEWSKLLRGFISRWQTLTSSNPAGCSDMLKMPGLAAPDGHVVGCILYLTPHTHTHTHGARLSRTVSTYMLLVMLWKSDMSESCLVFQVRSLKMKIVPSLSSDSMGTGPSAKPHFRLYITVATAVFQPIIIYWLTSHLVRWPSGVSHPGFIL